MGISKLALAAVLAAVWTAVPAIPRAEDQGGDEVGEGEHRGKHGGRGSGGGGPGEEMKPDRGGGDRHTQDPEMRERFEKMRDLEHKVHEAARKMRKGSDAEQAAVKTEIKNLLGDLFDAKLAMEEGMLAKIEKHAAELKAKIAKKKAGREKMIERRLARLSGEGDDWD